MRSRLAAQAGELVVDSLTNAVWKSGPPAGTLDGWLLDHWHSGQPVYDAVFYQQVPSALDWLLNTSGEQGTRRGARGKGGPSTGCLVRVVSSARDLGLRVV